MVYVISERISVSMNGRHLVRRPSWNARSINVKSWSPSLEEN